MTDKQTQQMKEIAERIKTRREELGLSFQQLAELTDMSKSTLQRYETGGIKNIPLDKLDVLSKALSTTPEWILGWDRKVSELDRTVLKQYPGFNPGKVFISDLEKSEDLELQEYLEELKNRSEMRMLFKLAKGATKEDVEKAVKIIEALTDQST